LIDSFLRHTYVLLGSVNRACIFFSNIYQGLFYKIRDICIAPTSRRFWIYNNIFLDCVQLRIITIANTSDVRILHVCINRFMFSNQREKELVQYKQRVVNSLFFYNNKKKKMELRLIQTNKNPIKLDWTTYRLYNNDTSTANLIEVNAYNNNI